MQTRFSEAQLADPDIRDANAILRSCVHCGFCNATCPTYALLGDELDGPRGRIYLIKQMLEQDRPPVADEVVHIDRCLSCLACMTTCPSGVHYMHLVDHARDHIEATRRRPWGDRLVRSVLGRVLPDADLFRRVLGLARAVAPLARALPGAVGRMARLVPAELENKVVPPDADAAAKNGTGGATVRAAEGERRHRVALLAGCVQQTLAPSINAATIRLLTRHGCDVVIAADAGCCGALTRHLGQAQPARGSAAANIRAWTAQIDDGGLDAVIVNASGCGTMVKDYGHLFRDDPDLSKPAARISALARDVSEYLAEIGLREPVIAAGARVAYQSACSLQHGQRVTVQPVTLLQRCGFTVVEPREAHLCCGSAGTYNILQGAIADRLQGRKAAALGALAADVVASGNIGCIMQLRGVLSQPIVHTAELLDWATGGPRPPAMELAAG